MGLATTTSFRHIMVAIIRLCSYKGELNRIAMGMSNLLIIPLVFAVQPEVQHTQSKPAAYFR